MSALDARLTQLIARPMAMAEEAFGAGPIVARSGEGGCIRGKTKEGRLGLLLVCDGVEQLRLDLGCRSLSPPSRNYLGLDLDI